MKAKTLLILAVVLVLCIGLAYMSRNPRREAAAPAAMSGKLVLPDLPVNDVARIVIESADGAVTYAKADGVWVSSDRFNYPVDFTRVRAFIQSLADMKIGQCVRANKPQMAKLQLVPPGKPSADDKQKTGTLVTLQDKAGSKIAELLLGKLHMSAPTDDTGPTIPRDFGGMPDGRYILVNGNVLLVSDTMEFVPATPNAWFDQQLINVQAGDMADISVTGAGREPYRISRPAGGGEMALENLEKNRKPSKVDIDSVLGSISYFRFEDIADPSLTNSATGLDDPVIFRAKVANGTVYCLRIGKPVEGGKSRYVAATVSFEPPPEEPAAAAVTNGPASGADTNAAAIAAEKAKQREALSREAEALNARISPWTYLVSEDVVKWCLKERKTLLAQEPESGRKEKDREAVTETPPETETGAAQTKPAREMKTRRSRRKASKSNAPAE